MPPRAAMVLGLAGLLPVAGAIVATLLVAHSDDPPEARLMIVFPALGYAALILSFIGGTWWTAACAGLGGTALWRWLGIAVLPSLWAAAGFVTGQPRTIAAMLALGLVLALVADRAALAAQIVPRWWMRLRVPLSCGLALETLAAGWLA